jgi:uncharacterized membrane protein YiaA
MRTARTLNWVEAIPAIWLILSPFLLGFSTMTVALWNALIVGAALLVLDIWAANIQQSEGLEQGLSWIDTILGIWLFLSPFILGFTAAPVVMWNALIVGVIVVVLSVWAAFSARSPMTMSQ